MNPAKSEFTADLLLYVLANEPDLPLYFGVYVSAIKPPLAKGEENRVVTSEVADPAYRRHSVRFVNTKNGFLTLEHDIQFPRASEKWDRVTHFAVFDAPKGGNLLLLKPTGGVTTVDAGEIVAILASEFMLYVGHNTLTLTEVLV